MSISNATPVFAVDEKNLVPVSDHLKQMMDIPPSRMFLINKSLKVYQEKNPGSPIYDASQGDGGASLPGVPKAILERAAQLQVEHGTAYDMPFGTDAYRKSVIEQYWKLDSSSGWGPANVLATAGGRDALVKVYQAMMALGHGRQGDLVMVSRVPWISYNWGPYGVGANVLWAPGDPAQGWAYSEESIVESVKFAESRARKLAGLVITNPDNPTGLTIPVEKQVSLAKCALDSGVAFVLFDWMYHYVTDESPMDLNSFLRNFTPEERKRIMFLDGITKSLGASNIRNCHLIADDAVVKFITARASHGVIPSFYSLAVAMAAYEMGFAEAAKTIVEPTNASRVVLKKLLAESGLQHIIGKGYYAFMNVGEYIKAKGWSDTEQLGQYLAENHGVAVVPGAFFSPFGGEWIRFSYATPAGRTEGAFKRLMDGLNSLKNSFTAKHAKNAKKTIKPLVVFALFAVRIFYLRLSVVKNMPQKFADKYLLAIEQAVKEKPESGLNGFEQEWNLLDEDLRPLLTVGAGPSQHSFVDYLRAECVPQWQVQFSQLEVFHWMIEWATRPYYSPRGAIYEARLQEASLINSLHRAGINFGERLHYWHGNLLFLTDIGHHSIPGNWAIAKRRYLEKCVDLYGDTLATTGIHTNMSLPDPLFAWDFMHLNSTERGDQHLDEFKSEFYITASRLLRAFAALFIATNASTPMQAQVRGGRAVVALTEFDSVRNLTFPNPPAIDLPDLYRSYNDYLQISYDLVRRGVRFGNNNWTPIRARSFAEPVERIISTTSDQLASLYARGLFAVGEATPPDEMALQIEKQNLMARINLPMGRVEIRTDEGGHSLDLDIANLTLKHLLLLRIYSDPTFARGFRYDREDITRARANETLAAKHGLRAEIENPLTGKPISMRAFLKWTLNEVKPLAKALNLWNDLNPLVEMSEGGRSTAEKIRARLQMELGENDEVPLSVLKELFYEREAQVKADVERIASDHGSLGADATKLAEFIQRSRDVVRQIPTAPIRFRPRTQAVVEISYPDKTAEILDLAQQLIRIPSVTASPNERLDEVHRAGSLVDDYLRNAGLEVKFFDGKYPAVYVQFPTANPKPPILLTGHFDVVEPDPDDSQFTPRIEGDYLWGRGAADMKTVVATYLVWMKDMMKTGKPFPNISLMLVGNEENGEAEAWGTPHVLKALSDHEDRPYVPALFIAGERTGEKGNELFGEICVENRGVMRFDVIARGAKGHSGVAGTGDLSEKLIAARTALNEIFAKHLTLKSADGWQSQAKFPFINVGTPGVYNVTAGEGILGVEIRPIPQDDVLGLQSTVEAYCTENGLELCMNVMENGVACSPDNPALKALIESVKKASDTEPRIGRKLPGTSARFAPGGQAVVWGQSGIGPHAKDERHYIPSIEPYYRSLNELAKLWK